LIEIPNKYREHLIQLCEWHVSCFYRPEPPMDINARQIERITDELYKSKKTDNGVFAIDISNDKFFYIFDVIRDTLSNFDECTVNGIDKAILFEMNEWATHKYNVIKGVRK